MKVAPHWGWGAGEGNCCSTLASCKANQRYKMIRALAGFTGIISSNYVTARSSASLMLRPTVSVGEGKRMTSCLQVFPSSLLRVLVAILSLFPALQKRHLSKSLIPVTSNCDYLRANYCLLHHPWRFPALLLSLPLRSISLSLALPPELGEGTAEGARLKSARRGRAGNLAVLCTGSWTERMAVLRVPLISQMLHGTICRDNR